MSRCKPCHNTMRRQHRKDNPAIYAEVNAGMKQRRQSNPEHYRKQKRDSQARNRDKRIFELYKLTPEDYASLLASQNGCCAICRVNNNGFSKYGKPVAFAVDHVHDTGVVRQLLCTPCNLAVGYVKENPAISAALTGYLIKHAAAAAPVNLIQFPSQRPVANATPQISCHTAKPPTLSLNK